MDLPIPYTNIYIDFDCFESVNVWSGSWFFFLQNKHKNENKAR